MYNCSALKWELRGSFPSGIPARFSTLGSLSWRAGSPRGTSTGISVCYVNFYARFVGDYQRDTRDLSLAEHGAYTLLLDHYYATEAPLPSDETSLRRICGVVTQAEWKAVQTVVTRFFTPERGTLRNARADDELPKLRARIEAARLNGKQGGRPPKNKTQSVSQQEPSGKATANPVGLLSIPIGSSLRKDGRGGTRPRPSGAGRPPQPRSVRNGNGVRQNGPQPLATILPAMLAPLHSDDDA